MRADRLLSLLMLLQNRGKAAAEDLAGELNVSVRTVYRDLQALETMGIPIYTERGPGGGCGLLDSFRTDLTGLTDGEIKSLFLLTVPGPVADLGFGQDFKGALNKLSASLSGGRRGEEARVRQRILIDWESPAADTRPEAQLLRIQDALWHDRSLILTLELGFGTIVKREVDPHGLVNRDGAWYMICRRIGQFRVYDLSRILTVETTSDVFSREESFILQDFWRNWWATHEANRSSFQVKALVSSLVYNYFPGRFFGTRRVKLDPVDQMHDRWIETSMNFTSLDEARRWIMAGGWGIKVQEPPELRASIADYARQISAIYNSSSGR